MFFCSCLCPRRGGRQGRVFGERRRGRRGRRRHAVDDASAESPPLDAAGALRRGARGLAGRLACSGFVGHCYRCGRSQVFRRCWDSIERAADRRSGERLRSRVFVCGDRGWKSWKDGVLAATSEATGVRHWTLPRLDGSGVGLGRGRPVRGRGRWRCGISHSLMVRSTFRECRARGNLGFQCLTWTGQVRLVPWDLKNPGEHHLTRNCSQSWARSAPSTPRRRPETTSCRRPHAGFLIIPWYSPYDDEKRALTGLKFCKILLPIPIIDTLWYMGLGLGRGKEPRGKEPHGTEDQSR